MLVGLAIAFEITFTLAGGWLVDGMIGCREWVARRWLVGLWIGLEFAIAFPVGRALLDVLREDRYISMSSMLGTAAAGMFSAACPPGVLHKLLVLFLG